MRAKGGGERMVARGEEDNVGEMSAEVSDHGVV